MCATLAILRRHINPLESPLYHLPPDLFPEVASHLTSDADLVNVTHVSYHLRNILLSFPSVWSHLDFECEMRARAFFERSAQTPLRLDMPRVPDRAISSPTELRQQSNRIAILRLRRWMIQKMFLSEPMPSLRRLEILSDYDMDDDWESDEGTWIRAWGSTGYETSLSFPSLTTFIIRNVDPVPFRTPHLTRFKFWDEKGYIGIHKLLIFLGNCPLLELIDILYWDELLPEQDPISLPYLRTYTESTFDQVCPLTVLNMLSLPPFCSVTLRSQDDETAAEADKILPRFKNPDYLVEIQRIKLRTIYDADGNEVVGVLELINTKGTRVCSQRMDFRKGHRPRVQGGKNHPHNVVHLNFLRNIDCRSVEILWMDGWAEPDIVTAEFLEETLGFGNVKTLILSGSAGSGCLSVLDDDLDEGDHGRRFPPIPTLIIDIDSYPPNYSHIEFLEPLFSVVKKRNAAGFPFKSILLLVRGDLLRGGPGWGSEVLLEDVRKCVERLEVVRGDDVLDRDVDKYFLDGLDHLQKN